MVYAHNLQEFHDMITIVKHKKNIIHVPLCLGVNYYWPLT